MRNTKPRIIVTGLLAAFALALTGCGKKNNQAGAPLPGQPGFPGQFPQGNIPPGGGLGSQCAPVTGPIPFSGTFYVNSASIVSGQGGVIQQPQQFPNQYNPYGGQQGMLQLSGSGSDAWMTMQIQMAGMNQGTGGGQMQLSSSYVQTLMYKIQSGQIPIPGISGQQYNPYNPYQQPQFNMGAICASIVSINIGHYATSLYGGQVNIMLNNSVPLVVYF